MTGTADIVPGRESCESACVVSVVTPNAVYEARGYGNLRAPVPPYLEAARTERAERHDLRCRGIRSEGLIPGTELAKELAGH
jgi:hypothetical protein